MSLIGKNSCRPPEKIVDAGQNGSAMIDGSTTPKLSKCWLGFLTYLAIPHGVECHHC